MNVETGKSRGGEWRAALAGGWHWWRDEMAALMPRWLRTQSASAVAIIAIDLEGEWVTLRRFAGDTDTGIGRLRREDFTAANLRAALGRHLTRPALLRDAFALRLPDATALKRNLSLPLAARGSIASLLDIELERQSPLEPHEIYHDYRVLGTDRRAGRIDIVWRIVRRRSVEAALAVCRQAGVGLAVIAFTGDDVPPDGGNFPVERRAALLLRLRRKMVSWLVLLIAALGAVIAVGAYGRGQSALDDLSARLETARTAARGSLQLEHQIAAVRQRAALIRGESARPGLTRLLAEVTRILPPGSWLTEFDYRDGEVRLRGVSNAASSLIGLFDGSPLFTGAEFRAPLTQSENPGQERFDLSFKLKAEAR